MTSDLTMAFGPPEARAAAMAGADPPDRISLRDHVVEVEIGAFQEERGRRQRIAFNVVVEVAPHESVDDDVDRILSYDTITEAIAAELAAERLNLLETLAGRIAERILTRPLALRVFIRIEKLDRGPGALGVEIVRSRPGQPARTEAELPAPLVCHLSNAAITAPGLSAWLDRLAPSGPVILTVATPAAASPRSTSPAAQRRIDLLALEQNAWVLAGRDRRCVVVATRTELAHAMKHRRICVWAPSKLVLDAVNGPAAQDPAALAAWLAGQLAARELVFAGCAPVDAPVQVRSLPLDALK